MMEYMLSPGSLKSSFLDLGLLLILIATGSKQEMVQSFGKHPIKLLITANSYCAKRSILNFARWELEQPGENPRANLIGEIAFLFTRLV